MTYALPKDSVVNLYDVAFGAKGDGTDDTAAWQAAVNAAITRGGTLAVPPPRYGSWHSIRDTITIEPQPTSGTQAQLDIKGGPLSSQIRWEGANNKAVFSSMGWKKGVIEGLFINAYGKTGIVAFDIDVDATHFSSGKLTFVNCDAAFGSSSVNCIGWRMGHSSSVADTSNLIWIDCHVSSDALGGHLGWVNENANALNFFWYGCTGLYMTKCWTNVATAGASGPNGGDTMYFYGCGAGYGATDFEFVGSGVYQIVGGRFEHGDRFLNISDGPAIPHEITVIGVRIAEYESTGGQMFTLGPNSSSQLTLMGSHIYRTSSNYYTNLIKFNSTSAGYSSLFASGNSIRADDPFYEFVGGVNKSVDIRPTNLILDSGGMASGFFKSRNTVVEGTNARMGLATLVAGAVTVSTTAVAANSRIMLTHQTIAGTHGTAKVSARTAGTSFDIKSYDGAGALQTADTSTVAWLIFDPA